MKVFVDEYHNLKLTQKLSAVNKVYHSAKNVFPNGYIASTLDKLTIATTTDQNNVHWRMATIRHLIDSNMILGDQLKQLSETNEFLSRQFQ